MAEKVELKLKYCPRTKHTMKPDRPLKKPIAHCGLRDGDECMCYGSLKRYCEANDIKFNYGAMTVKCVLVTDQELINTPFKDDI